MGRRDGLIDAVRALVAASTSFQTATGAEDAAEAAALVHYAGLPDGASRPCCLIHTLEDFGLPRVGQRLSVPHGSVQIAFVGTVDSAEVDAAGGIDDFETALADFNSWVGDAVDEMDALGGAPGYLVVRAIRAADGGEYTEERQRRAEATAEERGIDAVASFYIDYGLEG